MGDGFVVKSLTDYNIHEEIVEDGDSFNANALIKAKYCYEKTGIPSLGDDSGLVVESLDGRPGIFSARYAGDHDFAKNIEKQFGKPDVIAGVATGAIGIGMLVAEYMGLPFVYVRPEPKKHGRQNQVEGYLQKGQNVIVVEDLISTGGSSLLAVEALRNEGANVKGMAAIFTYGFPISKEKFQAANLDVYTLSNYENLIKKAVDKQYVSENEMETLAAWNANPAEWSVEV